jgi:hypothetical protein
MRMTTSNLNHFAKINSLLIKRERKDATYKFALLRGAIEICEHYDHQLISYNESEGAVFPLGLLIEQWMLYYYPIFEQQIPQQKSEKNNARITKFRNAFGPIIKHYSQIEGGFSVFANDLSKGHFSDEIKFNIFELAKEICNKITSMPMEYLGSSVEEKIFHHNKGRPKYNEHVQIDRQYLIDNFGTFSIIPEYYHAFVEVGPYLIGDNSILFSWAQFTHDAIFHEKSFGDLLKIIADEPVKERKIQQSKTFFTKLLKEQGNLKSVWSGKNIAHVDEEDLDHMIPFSVWKNNEYWNILPALKKENKEKYHYIPDPALLIRQKDMIIWYWNQMEKYDSDTFIKQIRVSLIGKTSDMTNWQEIAFASLLKKCKYLVEVRDFESWGGLQ